MNTVKKKVLFVASIDKHIQRFHLPSIKIFYDRNIEVDVACNGKSELPYVSNIHQIDFVRNPFSIGNIKALFQLRKLIHSGEYCLVHCHTAVASVLTRIVCRWPRKKGLLKVIYTAHGFHFFKGAPFYYWLLYYPVERFLSRFLDCLITINQEDYKLATEHFSCKNVKRISGMGVDPGRFGRISEVERMGVRESLGIPENAFVLIYVAEFIPRKNHAFLLDVASNLKARIPSLHILLPGRGLLWQEMTDKVNDNHLEHFIHLIGFRSDINKVLGCADIAVSTSKQEGLGLHLVEAMMCGLPVVASEDRGHKEIVHHGKEGFLYTQGNAEAFIDFVEKLYLDKDLRSSFSKSATENAMRFELTKSVKEIQSIYSELIDSHICQFSIPSL